MPPASSSRPHYNASELKTLEGGGLILYPKHLNIIWGNDKRYWRLSNDEKGSADLIQVCWLEVSGVVTVKASGQYRISFCVSLKPDSFGWNTCKPFVMAKVGKTGSYTHKPVNLTSPPPGGTFDIPNPNDKGDLVVDVKEGDQLYFGLYEVWSGKWKGGLEIRHASIQQVKESAHVLIVE